ncbi:Uncharacterised protein [Bordetella pertussis]|nr:Uncharacterised protein [Bordetella pertussis]
MEHRVPQGDHGAARPGAHVGQQAADFRVIVHRGQDGHDGAHRRVGQQHVQHVGMQRRILVAQRGDVDRVVHRDIVRQHRRQARLGGGVQLGKSQSMGIGLVGEQGDVAARYAQRGDTLGMLGAEAVAQQLAQAQHLVHVVGAGNAVLLGHVAHQAVVAGQRAGVRQGHARARLPAPQLEQDHRFAQAQPVHRVDHLAGGALGFGHGQHHARGRILEHVFDQVAVRDASRIAGIDDMAEAQPVALGVVRHRCIGQPAALRHQRHVAHALGPLEHGRGRGHDARRQVGKAHAVGADEGQRAGRLLERALRLAPVAAGLGVARDVNAGAGYLLGAAIAQDLRHPLLADHDHAVVDLVRNIADRGEAAQAGHFLVARVDRIDGAFVAAFAQRRDQLAGQLVGRRRGADDCDAARIEQLAYALDGVHGRALLSVWNRNGGSAGSRVAPGTAGFCMVLPFRAPPCLAEY